MPVVIYYLSKDVKEDEENAQPIVKPANAPVFPGEGDRVRFGHEFYCVEKVLWDLFPDGQHVVTIGLVTLQEAIEQEFSKLRREPGQGGREMTQ